MVDEIFFNEEGKVSSKIPLTVGKDREADMLFSTESTAILRRGMVSKQGKVAYADAVSFGVLEGVAALRYGDFVIVSKRFKIGDCSAMVSVIVSLKEKIKSDRSKLIHQEERYIGVIVTERSLFTLGITWVRELFSLLLKDSRYAVQYPEQALAWSNKVLRSAIDYFKESGLIGYEVQEDGSIKEPLNSIDPEKTIKDTLDGLKKIETPVLGCKKRLGPKGTKKRKLSSKVKALGKWEV